MLFQSYSYYIYFNNRENENVKIDKDNLCEIGENEKCAFCDKNINKCIKCNPGYLLSNNKCIINYSFKLLYKTSKDNETISLSNFLIFYFPFI